MIELNLGKEKADILAEKISSIYKKYAKRKYVDCIYANLYRDEYSGIDKVKVTIVCDKFEYFEQIIGECRAFNSNSSYRIQYKTGIQIELRADYTSKYTMELDGYNVHDRRMDILNGHILLDRTNLFNKIKDNNRYCNFEYSNNLEIRPKINMKSGNK